jgi:hypothetical protein
MAEERVDREVPVREAVAQREEIEVHEPTVLAQVAPTKATPAPASAAPAGNLPTAPRYDFDLEHGTPMPPETRGGKPAY